MMISNSMRTLINAKIFPNQIPPRRENEWIRHATVAAPIASPLTALFVTGALAAWRVRIPKIRQFPAMFPRIMYAVAKTQVMRRTVRGRYAGQVKTYCSYKWSADAFDPKLEETYII
jgi:hypothetical protein